MKLQAWH